MAASFLLEKLQEAISLTTSSPSYCIYIVALSYLTIRNDLQSSDPLNLASMHLRPVPIVGL